VCAGAIMKPSPTTLESWRKLATPVVLTTTSARICPRSVAMRQGFAPARPGFSDSVSASGDIPMTPRQGSAAGAGRH